MRRTGEDEGLNENGARRSAVIYAGADEGLSKSTEIREAYKEEKPNCGGEEGLRLGEGGGEWLGGFVGLSSSVRWLIYKSNGEVT